MRTQPNFHSSISAAFKNNWSAIPWFFLSTQLWACYLREACTKVMQFLKLATCMETQQVECFHHARKVETSVYWPFPTRISRTSIQLIRLNQSWDISSVVSRLLISAPAAGPPVCVSYSVAPMLVAEASVAMVSASLSQRPASSVLTCWCWRSSFVRTSLSIESRRTIYFTASD